MFYSVLMLVSPVNTAKKIKGIALHVLAERLFVFLWIISVTSNTFKTNWYMSLYTGNSV